MENKKTSNKNWQKSIIVVAVISLFIGSIAGALSGFYAAALIGSGDLPALYSLLYQKLFHPQESVSSSSPPLSAIADPSPLSLQGAEQQSNLNFLSDESSVIFAVEQVSPSVVSIVVSKYVQKYYGTLPQSPYDDFFNDDFFDWPFNFRFERGPSIPTPVPQPEEQEKEKKQIGGGTGFVISGKDGLILTNKHVVSDEEAEYTVVSNDGDKYDAEVLARDPFNDMAILKIDDPDFNLPEVKLGDSDNLKIGQTVIAIGNALGEYRNTVTKGVISGISRRIVAGDITGRSEVLENVIQTDAAINLGNSGGPLINISGQVIGINTAISRQGQLIGFAIPINQAKSVIESVKKYGRIVRPFLGVRYVLINEKIAKANNLEIDYGALIVRGSRTEDLAIVPGSAADKAGLVENDIILELNGNKITQTNSLAKQIQKYKPGDEVEFKILHDNQEKIITTTLEEYKE